MHRVIVIGAGQLGSRHLQGLAKSTIPLKIDVVDPSDASLNIAASRFAEVQPTNAGADYMREVPAGEEYDLAIIACSSGARLSALRELYRRSRARYLVLEKFLFSKLEEYDEAEKIIVENGVAAWVNCPRRIMPDYAELKTLFSGPVDMSVRGGMWGLGCNSIHMADLAAWLSGDTSFSFDASRLDRVVHRSSRSGYIEFSGLLTGWTDCGTRVSLLANRDYSGPSLIHLVSSGAQALICEADSTVTWWRGENGWKPESGKLRIVYQSGLSNSLAEEILERGSCGLASYRESATMHRALLRELREFHATIGGAPAEFAIT